MATLTEPRLVGADYYRVLVEMAPDAMVVTDPQGRVVMANERAAELWGAANPDDVVGLDGLEIIAEADRPRATEDLRTLVTEGTPIRTEYTIVRPNGETAIVESSAKILLDGQGRPTAILAVARDVTKRKLSEATLRASERQHAAVAELGWWALKSKDLGDLMQLAVRTVVGTLGVDFAAVCEVASGTGLFTVRAAVGWPDDLTAGWMPADGELARRYGVKSDITAVMQGQDARFGFVGAYSRRAEHFNPEAAHFMQSVANIVVTAIERQRAEQALRQREQEFRALVDNAPDVIARFGRDNILTYLNPAGERIVGRSLDTIGGHRSYHLPLPEPAQIALDLGLSQVFRSGREQVIQLSLPGTVGEHAYQARLSPEFGENRTVEYVLVVAREIDDVRRSSEGLEQLYQELVQTRRFLEGLNERVATRQAAPLPELPLLTRRERQVLRLVAEGLTNQSIGARLSISSGTVKNHLRNALPKLNAVSRSQAVARAVDLGLLSLVDGAA